MQDHPDYRITEKLYEGAHSIVYRAVRRDDGLPVIIKRFNAAYPDPSATARFQQEFTLSRQLHLSCMVEVLTLENYRSSPFLVLEDFGGTSLDRLLGGRGLPVQEALELAAEIADILQQVHDVGIIHRDLNPSNLIRNATTGELKLTDFGLALVLPSETTSFRHPDCLEGTLAYMSPEQTGRMNQPLDYRTDLYSLGCILYELFAGHPPFVCANALDTVHAHLALKAPPLQELRSDLPPAVADIVMKLLNKEKEERYQSAFGVRCDLLFCLEALQGSGDMARFVPARHDLPAGFHVPHKLYGRQEEIRTLLEAYRRARRGPAEILLVAGYSGVGKSTLVHEMHKPVTEARGYFAAGKFNQYQRNVPYSAIREALTDFCRYILTEDNAQLQRWRREILQAVGSQGQVLIEIVPALELIIGEQPAVEAISPQEAQRRFTARLRDFLAVICRPEHPLVFFIDDWQWADQASIDLLLRLFTEEELKHALFICAYRDNEVSPPHPFMLALQELGRGPVPSRLLRVDVLGRRDLSELIADTVRQAPAEVADLVEIVSQKTLGNPFFVRVFLQSLYDEGLLRFDRSRRRWVWDAQLIRRQDFTDNVVEMLLGKIRRFAPETRRVLSLAACLGSRFDLQTLSIISILPPEKCLETLWPVLAAGLLLPLDEAYHLAAEAKYARQIRFRFLHDRVQQSAYALIGAGERAATHLRIARLLLAELAPEQRAERIFEIVDHLNEGSRLIDERDQQVELIALNLEAARKAKGATAYGAALQYHLAAAACLADADLAEHLWADHYLLALALHKERAEIESLNGHFEVAEELIRQTVERARKPMEKADVLHVLIVQYTLQAKYPEAIATGRQALQALGVELPAGDYEAARDRELELTLQALEGRSIPSLFELPVMDDPEQQTIARLLITMGPPCYRSHQRLWAVIVPKVINLCLRHGNIPQVGYSHTAFGGLLGYVRNDYERAVQFGDLATRLMSETFTSSSDRSVFHLMIGSSLRHWSRHLRCASEDYLQAYQVGLSSGNLQYAAYAFGHDMYCRFYQGSPLAELYRQTQNSLDFSRSRRNQWAVDLLEGGLLVFGTLAGLHETPFHLEHLSEADLLRRCEENRNSQIVCIYNVLKTLALYLQGEHEQAWTSSRECEPLIYTVATQGLLPWAEHLFARQLILGALRDGMPADRQEECLRQMRRGLRQLQVWAAGAPENFDHKRLLAAAEIAAVEDRFAAAVDLYDQAISAALDGGFTHCAAMANECAGRFWLRRGKDHLARVYLQQARDLFAAWGAAAVVRRFDERYGEILPSVRAEATASSSSGLQGLDAATILTAAQSLSETVQLEPLLRKLLHLAVTHAGAESGTLLIPDGDLWKIQARGDSRQIAVLQGQPLDASQLPASIVRYVLRTRQTLILDRPQEMDFYSHDPYLRRVRPKSVCCLPLLHRGELIALLYLENGLAGGVFTAEQTEILRLLSSLMASAVVNAHVYEDLDSAVRRRTAELQASQEELQQRNAELERLTYTVSHDLKTPLVTIRSFLGFLRQDMAAEDAEAIAVDMGFIEGACGKMMTLLEELLQMMRVGRVVNEPVEVAFAAVVHEALDLVAGRIAERQVAVRVGEGDAALFGDRARLVEIWQNLLDNAVKYLGEQAVPAVEIGLDKVDEETIFFVRDNGIGIEPAYLEKVFGLFERLDSGVEGTGIGLALVKRIVELYGGRIWVESQGAGHGACFRFTLPQALRTEGWAAEPDAGMAPG